MTQPKFGILITTKNRIEDLKFTLSKISHLIHRPDVECIIWDDGSSDNTYDYIKNNHPEIQIFKNETSKGLIYSRNRLLEKTKAVYAISIDDDLHFITQQPLEVIEAVFSQNNACAVISFRIFWSTSNPETTEHNQQLERVKNFAGGAHVWRMNDWKQLPDYPEWFIFYGEENFASFNLFKNNKQVLYAPDILCHHRVDLIERKNNHDYILRQRRSLRAGWYLYLLFYPIKLIPQKFAYSLWMQLKLKVFKGQFKTLVAIVQALGDVVLNTPKLIANSNRLSLKEFKEFSKLPDVKLYWKPNNTKH